MIWLYASFRNLGVPFLGPYNKDYEGFRSMSLLESPCCVKPPYEKLICFYSSVWSRLLG